MKKEISIEPSWKKALEGCFNSESFDHLADFIDSEYRVKTIYPQRENVFKAFKLTPFDKVRVVILGQDPYHGAEQAEGLSFSVQTGTKLPPSLRNIYKEIESDLGIRKDFTDGHLASWAKQGVFLLNSILTVVANSPASHQKHGWEEFTDAVIGTISDKHEHIVFILWGNYARSKKSLIDTTRHLVIESPHPSPFSAYSGFFGSKCFSICNKYLSKNNFTRINW